MKLPHTYIRIYTFKHIQKYLSSVRSNLHYLPFVSQEQIKMRI